MGRNGVVVVASPRKCLLPQGHKLNLEEPESVALRIFFGILTEHLIVVLLLL